MYHEAVQILTFALAKGRSVSIAISNRDTDGYVVADGVQLLKAD